MIRLQNVYKEFALHNINLKIKKGELVLINGVSGSGKTTLLNIIASFMKPDSGLVEIEGENIVSLSDYHLCNYRKNRLAYVTQPFHLFEQLTVEENLLPALLVHKLSHKEMQEAIKKALHMAAISHKAKQHIKTLSGGEKQRCIIARALVNNPQIILCDEPTANLDKENSLEFMKIIEKLHTLGKTILIASHDPLLHNLKNINQNIYLSEGKIE